MKLALIIAALLVSVNAMAQENIEKTIGNFNELKVYDLINVTLIKSDENKAVISGHQPHSVELINKNGTLKVQMRLEEKFDGNNTKVILYFKDIDVIDVNEGAYVTSVDTFQQFKIELRAQEGGIIRIDLDVSENKVKAVTGGEIEVSGTAVRQDISINTGGIFQGETSESEATYVAISAAGEAIINVSKLADIKIRAGGDVYIYGNPETVNESKLFGGRIVRMD
ncbi:head GIN domain-containing protein [Gelidibacter mesophilus]|uniref:head GIN domain-containing protein n=1 Tax=Gelidibacter mesophilus TaxID=169050 RepID=UPI00047F1C07|nr:head GIN domain-containing protein [Gelidibacter mesophilus]